MFKMEVYTPDLELIGFLEIFKSALFEEYAYKAGTFSVESILTPESIEMLRPDNIIWFEKGYAGIIEYIDLKTDETGQYITAKGSMLTGILSRRIMWGGYSFYDTPENIMRYAVNDCAVEPTKGDAEKRKIPRVVISKMEIVQGVNKIRKSQTGGTLLDFLTETGEANNTAFGLNFNAKDLRMEFFTHSGVDRTIKQKENEPVFFSAELDDVLNAEYTYSSSDYANSALIAGQGDGEQRIFEEINSEDSGLSRRELYVDARDLAQEELTAEEYRAILNTRGRERLAEMQLSYSFDADIRTNNQTYVFGVDFFLGDKITVKDERLGVVVDAVVTGFQKSNSVNGEQMTLYFGFGVPTINEKLKRKADR